MLEGSIFFTLSHDGENKLAQFQLMDTNELSSIILALNAILFSAFNAFLPDILAKHGHEYALPCRQSLLLRLSGRLHCYQSKHHEVLPSSQAPLKQ